MDEQLELINPTLVVSADYQRPINRNKVNYYKQNVNGTPRYLLPTATPIILSFRDNKYWVVDGQHRLMAMAEDGVIEYECLVTYGLNYNQEKKLFLQHWIEKTGGVVPGA